MSEPDHHSAPNLTRESDPNELKLIMQQYVEQIAQQCQHQMQRNLDQIWIASEQKQASLAQRMVSDHLAMVDEGTSKLPSYHPLHWLEAQLEFKLRGILEFRNKETAQSQAQEILDRLQSEIALTIAYQQAAIAEEFDRQIQDMRKSLATTIQPRLQEKKVIITEYINSYIPVAKLQLRGVDKFGFFQKGQRISAKNIVTDTTTTISPWYFLGLQKQQRSVYQISRQQFQTLLQESLTRTFRDTQTQINSYVEIDLHQQIQNLLASV